MQQLKPTTFFLALGILLFTACQSDTTTIQTKEGPIEISSEELLKIMGETYLYGYPLVLMDLTQRRATNIEQPHPVVPSAPINQLGHYRKFPDHTSKGVVKPNVDTYYSSAWLDLSTEPVVLSMPATERYYLLQMMDAYTNVFAAPGTRTTGTGAQQFLIAGPNWVGALPEGLELIKSPTNLVWMLGRIQVNSIADGATTVKAIQDSMRLVPLSAYDNEAYVAPLGTVKAENNIGVPAKAIRDIDVPTFFNKMAEMMVKNPPKIADSSMVKKMAKIGLVAGEPFELSADNFILKTKLKVLPSFIQKKMDERRANPDTSFITNGWTLLTDGIGKYDTDYMRRAYISFIGLGANLPEDAVYPNLTYDVNGEVLDASQQYQLHFDAEQLPPVNAFWSLTAYNEEEFLVENDLNRFALGDRDDLTYNADGSLDFYIQSKPPEKDKIKNWLPIPQEGLFFLTMRLYWPKQEVLDGEWKMPYLIPVE